jgi:hypothetical protein
MTIKADLTDLSAAEFLLMLALNRKTGRLTVESEGGRVKVAFREGAIVYAASTGVREAVGTMLIRRELISDEDLKTALQRQRQATGVSLLGNILVEMGALSQEDLEAVVYVQFQNALRDALMWQEGTAEFETEDVPDLGAVEIDPREIVLETGISTEQLVLDGVSEIDAAPAEDQGEEGREAARSMLNDLQGMSLSVTSEMAAILLDHAAQQVKRALLFLVYSDVLSVVGGLGIVSDGEAIGLAGRRLKREEGDDSVISWVINEGRSYRGKLKEGAGNKSLTELLGNVVPKEVIALPVIVEGEVTAVLYGDNGADEQPIGSIGGLEREVARVAREMHDTRRGYR